MIIFRVVLSGKKTEREPAMASGISFISRFPNAGSLLNSSMVPIE